LTTEYSRVGIWCDIEEKIGKGGRPLFSKQEIKDMFAGCSVRITDDGYDWIQRLASIEDGGLRMAGHAILLACEFVAAGQYEEISADALDFACQLLRGVDLSRLTKERMKQARVAWKGSETWKIKTERNGTDFNCRRCHGT
jgi:hypothetical protein